LDATFTVFNSHDRLIGGPYSAAMGDRVHLLNRGITIDTFVEDPVQILTEELSRVVLVGHSLGGISISGTADHVDQSKMIDARPYDRSALGPTERPA
jgi:hypothetical protein